MGGEPTKLSKVLVKALVDRTFRQALIDNPEQAVANAGIQLSSEEMQTIEDVEVEQWGSMTLQELNNRLAVYPTMDAYSHDSGPGI